MSRGVYGVQMSLDYSLSLDAEVFLNKQFVFSKIDVYFGGGENVSNPYNLSFSF